MCGVTCNVWIMYEVSLYANGMELILVCNILTQSSLLMVIDGY
jgi:hypothetical protein